METQTKNILLVCTGLFFLFSWSKQLKSESLFSERVQEGDLKTINGLQTIAIAILLLPILIDPSCFAGYLKFPGISISRSVALLLSMLTVAVVMQVYNVEKQHFRFSKDAIFPLHLYVLLRIAFIILYEWFMRGLLLTASILWFGLPLAIFINLAIYVLLHSHKTMKEMLGCIPFGLLVVGFAIWWNSPWPAVILHLQLCLSYELPHLKKYLLIKKHELV
jgi:hypothetical protein